MKKLLLLAVAFAAFGFAASANAADMPVKAAKPVAPLAYRWTGLYVGLQGGYAWGSSIQTYNAGSTDRYDISGWEGGGTLGYNWQVDPQWVFGVETDISGAHISGSGATMPSYGCGTICSTTVNAFGTLRGRIGYAFNNILVYGTGGLAYASIESDLDDGTKTNWRAGWTAGGGVEYGFAPNWSAKLEYLYASFGSFVWTNETNANYSCLGIACSTDARFSVVRAGLNYRFMGF
jgi:outer membrane immunogenic protein